MKVRKYITISGVRHYDYAIQEEILCDHCGQEVEDVCLVSIRISSAHLTTEMGQNESLALHADCIYAALREHVMERSKDQAGRWYVAEERAITGKLWYP